MSRPRAPLRATPAAAGPLGHNPAWMDAAACIGHDPALWHPARHDAVTARIAIAICRDECPVQDECLQFAFTTEDTWAILGGTTPRQRRRLRPPTPAPQSGRRRCDRCGKLFHSPYSGSRYCPSSCSVEARRERDRKHGRKGTA